MSAFRGRYEHQMDEKGRVSLPSAFRRGEGEDRFVLLQWEKPYLALFPEAKWEEIEARLADYKKTGAQAMNQVIREFNGRAQAGSDAVVYGRDIALLGWVPPPLVPIKP